MEEIIKRIIQIEEEAAEIEKRVEAEMKRKRQEQDKALEKLQRVLRDKAMSKVNTLREWEMKTADEEIKKQQEISEKWMEMLTKAEIEKTEEWVSHLFAEITKE